MQKCIHAIGEQQMGKKGDCVNSMWGLALVCAYLSVLVQMVLRKALINFGRCAQCIQCSALD